MTHGQKLDCPRFIQPTPRTDPPGGMPYKPLREYGVDLMEVFYVPVIFLSSLLKCHNKHSRTEYQLIIPNEAQPDPVTLGFPRSFALLDLLLPLLTCWFGRSRVLGGDRPGTGNRTLRSVSSGFRGLLPTAMLWYVLFMNKRKRNLYLSCAKRHSVATRATGGAMYPVATDCSTYVVVVSTNLALLFLAAERVIPR